jgi:cytochrome oxidase assembly protein ShyY1
MSKSGKWSSILALGGLTAIACTGCYWQTQRYYQKKDRWTTIEQELSKFRPYELKGEESSNFPWFRDDKIDDWEYHLVKLKGRLGPDRIFVRKPFEGRMGFDVMAPLYTSERTKSNDTALLENGIIVDLGWVPAEKKEEVLPKTPTTAPTVIRTEKEKSCNQCFQKRTYLKSLAWFVKENVKTATQKWTSL